MNNTPQIKVKAYGLINFTKRQYLITQFVVFSLTAIFTVLSIALKWELRSGINLYLLVAIVIIGEIIETYFMLRKFAQKEAESKQ